MKFWPSGCSEFPNDNPAIHDGAVWVCAWTRARPRAFLRARSPAATLTAPSNTSNAQGNASPESQLQPSPPIAVPTLDDPFIAELEPLLAGVELGGEMEPITGAPDPLSQVPPSPEPTPLTLAEPPSPGLLDTPNGSPAAQPDPSAELEEEPEVELDLRDTFTLESFLNGESLPAPRDKPEPTRAVVQPLELEDLSQLRSEAPWQHLVASLTRHLLDQGHTRAAAVLPQLLEGRPINVMSLPQRVQQCLLLANIASSSAGEHLGIAPEFRASARRLRAACAEEGSSAAELGPWLAQVVRALTASAADEAAVMGDLERAGVMGLLERVA